MRTIVVNKQELLIKITKNRDAQAECGVNVRQECCGRDSRERPTLTLASPGGPGDKHHCRLLVNAN